MKVIDKWLAKTGMAEGRLGLLACANPKAIERIRTGRARIETLNAVLSYIKRNPPKAKRRALSTS